MMGVSWRDGTTRRAVRVEASSLELSASVTEDSFSTPCTRSTTPSLTMSTTSTSMLPMKVRCPTLRVRVSMPTRTTLAWVGAVVRPSDPEAALAPDARNRNPIIIFIGQLYPVARRVDLRRVTVPNGG